MGKYIDNNLIKEENVIFETYYHWIIFCNLRAILTLFIAPVIDKYTDEFAITNKRVIIKTGLISRKTFEMNHSKIESINVEQGLLGRLLGYGTIRVVGSGGTKESFPKIQNPLEFRKKFQEMSN
ncbi:PH domain-containing protein [uncultured Flavobacterium sp.]|uniref:PH domain-containing protein n=1 Tax=uncultured Flavobacterium sp. TaxID=165435 RepID=UPI0030EB8719|tara:strand:- start:699 stop:1070 length:372 start_codon:yes stop_codon:yes gene_type:complete